MVLLLGGSFKYDAHLCMPTFESFSFNVIRFLEFRVAVEKKNKCLEEIKLTLPHAPQLLIHNIKHHAFYSVG